jgi:NAD(P)H-dependent flavin oxidoreductase YrpB (nitropropane dioxygenase family)
MTGQNSLRGRLREIGVGSPVLGAPMAGGPSTPALVRAAASAGSLAFLAGGYKAPELLSAQIREVRDAGAAVAVNLFAPAPVPVDPDLFRRYAAEIAVDAATYVTGTEEATPIEDDDRWQDKIDLLLTDPVPVVGFTFGIPDTAVIDALHRAGSVVLQTVTSAAEARQAAAAGVDALVVQASAAGGHSGTLTPEAIPPQVPLPQLVAEVRATVELPLGAAGGIGSADDVTAALAAGAEVVLVGTLLLRADESGASAPYRAALADPARTTTVVTRAFTGRPARALPNGFTDRHTAAAPVGYPALHHLTSPMRRAAAAAGDPERINLWAGTGHRQATARPAARILDELAGRV